MASIHDLPTEIILQITEHFYTADSQTFNNCLLTCRRWYEILRFLPWTDMSIKTSTISRTLRMLQSIKSTELTRIKSMTITLDRTDDPQREIEWFRRQDPLAVLFEVMRYMPELEAVFLDARSQLRHTLFELDMSYAALLRRLPQSVRHLSLNMNFSQRQAQDFDPKLHTCLTIREMAPQLISLHLSDMELCPCVLNIPEICSHLSEIIIVNTISSYHSFDSHDLNQSQTTLPESIAGRAKLIAHALEAQAKGYLPALTTFKLYDTYPDEFYPASARTNFLTKSTVVWPCSMWYSPDHKQYKWVRYQATETSPIIEIAGLAGNNRDFLPDFDHFTWEKSLVISSRIPRHFVGSQRSRHVNTIDRKQAKNLCKLCQATKDNYCALVYRILRWSNTYNSPLAQKHIIMVRRSDGFAEFDSS